MLLVASLFVTSAFGARLLDGVDSEVYAAGGAVGGLRSGMQAMLKLARGKGKGDDDKDLPAIAAIKFIVPPSEGDDFEEAWLKLEDKVQKDEDIDIFDLKKTKLDNLLYLSYGEWKDHSDLHEHLTSDHFEEFAKFVDERGIRWQLEELFDESEDVEDDSKRSRRHMVSKAALATLSNPSDDAQVKELYKSLMKKKNLAHVIFKYYVPPTEAKGFADAWTDAAEKTLEERGNRIYSLRKVATDNTLWYGYGTWDSMRDYLEHLESKHVGKLLDFFEDKDIVWFLSPLAKIGNQDE